MVTDTITPAEPMSAYTAAADDILACLMITLRASRPYYDRVRFHHVLDASDMPNPRYLSLYSALLDFHERGTPIHDTAIMEVCEGAGVSWAWLAQLRALMAPGDKRSDMEVFDENVRIVKRGGLALRASNSLRSAAQKIETGQYTPDTQIRYTLDVLTDMLMSGRAADRRVLAAQIADDFERALAEPDAAFAPTGLPWLDNLISGHSASRLMYIAGAYKSGKTRLALNLAIECAMQGQSVAIYSVEMTWRDVAAVIVSMLAVGYLQATGNYAHTDTTSSGKTFYSHWISAAWLRRTGASYQFAGRVRADAITWAIRVFRGWGDRLRIYTSERDRGNVNSFGDLQLAIQRDAELHAGTVHFVDYLQLLSVDGLRDQTDKNRLSVIAPGLQRMTQQRAISIVALVQLNEERIKLDDADNYSPGVSGGSDVPKTADYLITVRPGDPGNSDGTGATTKLQMHKSRWSDAGAQTICALSQHRSSGLLLDMAWIKSAALP